MARYALGFDLSTTCARVIIVDIADGRCAGRAERARPGQAPQDLLATVADACSSLTAQATADLREVIGIGVALANEGMLDADTFLSQLRDDVGRADVGRDDVGRADVRDHGCQCGRLSATAAHRLGLRGGIPLSVAVSAARAHVPGVGVAAPSTMVMALDADAHWHLLNSRVERSVPGTASAGSDGILPGYFGYEARAQSLFGALGWIARHANTSHDALSREAAGLPPGSAGVLAQMPGEQPGAFVGVTRSTRPAQLYRALIEASAFQARRIVDALRDAGVPVRRFVATGESPRECPLLLQVYADVLGEKITHAARAHPAALGAAVLGCLAAGREMSGYASISQAIHAMARQRDEPVYRPDLDARRTYHKLYALYRALADADSAVPAAMRQLRTFAPPAACR